MNEFCAWLLNCIDKQEKHIQSVRCKPCGQWIRDKKSVFQTATNDRYWTWRIASHHTIPHHTIPYHTIPHHTIPYHSIQDISCAPEYLDCISRIWPERCTISRALRTLTSDIPWNLNTAGAEDFTLLYSNPVSISPDLQLKNPSERKKKKEGNKPDGKEK